MREIDFPTSYDEEINNEFEWMKRNAFGLYDKARHAPSTLSFKYYLINLLMSTKYVVELHDMLNGVLWKDKPAPWIVQRDILTHPEITKEDIEFLIQHINNTEESILEEILYELEQKGRGDNLEEDD